MSIYEEMIAAGVEYDHHESDLYVKDCQEARDVLKMHDKKVDGWNVERFTNEIDGTPWLDIPFAYTPYWDAVRTLINKMRGA